uniref:Helitron_like_N domain-containing protein n=1 Tax=Onchocerca flexuosa TaxID=387005 RepID=A0A183HES4_9BILA
LQSSYAGIPRHILEYAQDVIAYIRYCERPDLFITFKCNPVWDDMQNLLFPAQSPTDRHDITARVSRKKMKSLMDFMVKCFAFGYLTENMIYGPYGTLNPKSPCMMDGKCSERYPRALLSNSIAGNDGYPLYRRSAADGSKLAL